ncbi:MAG: ABC-type transport auxiliary lipoprotein family protein [Acidobacteriota bacterium]
MKTVVSQSKGWENSAGYLKAVGVALLAVLMCTACASTPKTRYYTLHVPPSPGASTPRTHLVLQVERFDASDILRDDRIIYYKSPTELNFYRERRWSSDPGELLTELAVKYFAGTGLFRQVYLYPAPIHADYTLQGRVLDLAQMQYEKGAREGLGQGKVGLKLELIRTDRNKVVWSARLEDSAPIRNEKIQGVVDALNRAAGDVMQKAYGGISQVIEHELAQKQEQAH